MKDKISIRLDAQTLEILATIQKAYALGELSRSSFIRQAIMEKAARAGALLQAQAQAQPN